MKLIPNAKALLVVGEYPKHFRFMGFLSMALFHFPLALNRKVLFYKLMGTGKNGSFDIQPDLSKWTILVFFKQENTPNPIDIQSITGSFITKWWKRFRVQLNSYLLEPYTGHGTWDGRTFTGQEAKGFEPEGKIAVLTRATIRISRMISFWKAVPGASYQLEHQPGLLFSIGIGEVPFIKQATFSFWESEAHMKAFAYGQQHHKQVIRRTRKESWYSEEMFLRFKVLKEALHLEQTQI